MGSLQWEKEHQTSVLDLPFVQCVTLGTLLNPSEPLLSLLKKVRMHKHPTRQFRGLSSRVWVFVFYKPGREMQMLVVVITVISIWFGYRVSMERSINHKPVTLLGTLDVSGMVCVCVCVEGGWGL